MRTILVLLLLPLLLACQSKPERTSFAVELTDVGQLDPGSLKVPLGATVRWKNTGLIPRQIAPIQGQNSPLHSGWLYPGEVWSYTFTQPGTYRYAGLYRSGFQGMAHEQDPLGVLEVGAGAPARTGRP